MGSGFVHEATLTLNDLECRLERMSRQAGNLKQYNGWTLRRIRTSKSGDSFYSAKRPGTSRKVYLGNGKHPALDGTMMRSKSEVIIANILLLAGIPFVYEVPVFINGNMVLPDFRILSVIDLKTEILIEHQGMIFDDDYADKFIRSLKLYLNSDWIPNKNLFFTFDDAKERINTDQVTDILRAHIFSDL